MKVITTKPVVVNGRVMSDMLYSNGNGDGDKVPAGTSASTTSTISRADKVKAGLDKAKGVYQKGQESGIFQSIGNLLGLGKKDTPAVAPAPAPTPTPEVKPDNTMKYVLIGGGVLAVGVIVYLATRKK